MIAFPACAGMNRKDDGGGCGRGSVPRAGGDEPCHPYEEIRVRRVSRARGDEPPSGDFCKKGRVRFPPQGALRAGVDLTDKEDIVMQYRSLLHVAATGAKKELRVSWSGVPSAIVSQYQTGVDERVSQSSGIAALPSRQIVSLKAL